MKRFGSRTVDKHYPRYFIGKLVRKHNRIHRAEGVADQNIRWFFACSLQG